jgi:hypothetical protein
MPKAIKAFRPKRGQLLTWSRIAVAYTLQNTIVGGKTTIYSIHAGFQHLLYVKNTVS